MHGRSPPSFFLTKKNPADAGDMDGRMKPFANSSSMYDFMASDSGCDRGKTRPLGGCELGCRSMAQSLERWGGSCEALVLLKASIRSWYSIGSLCAGRGAGLSLSFWRVRSRQRWRQASDHWVICLSDQEMVGLCFPSQESPRMMGVWGDWKTNSRMVSVWKAPVHSDRSSVVNWIRPVPSGRPSSAATAKWDSQTQGESMSLWKWRVNEISRCPRVDQSRGLNNLPINP